MSHLYTSSDFADLVYIIECLSNAEFNFKNGTIILDSSDLDYELSKNDIEFCERILTKFGAISHGTTRGEILKTAQKCIENYYK
ncbi:Hypothetical protein PACV_421 [Pacmanvirus A23]|uniref:Hypothetical protein n=1 Tax=Pacmanvirus A23 TaxID=1932881 RepID=UPI000A09497C|nr:Hypothetical protein B9W72_gp417 [Pacmanvirus A23]SIP86134.1 Hypothetical protein PACV_421 [Pacmanvirus A23]